MNLPSSKNPGTLLCLFIMVILPFSSAHSENQKELRSNHPINLVSIQTGYLLGAGGNKRVGLGESGFGIAEKFQFTTNTQLDLLTFLNGQVKLGVLDDRNGIPAVAVGLGYYNLISSNFIVEEAVRAGFSDREMDIESGLEVFSVFASVSKQLHEMARVHAGYQYRYLKGHVDSDRAFELTSQRDTVAVYLSLDQDASHHSIVSGLDVNPASRVKLLVELGYDISYGRGRGGAGIRINPVGGFNIQVGILWPGIDLDEDIEIPVIPQFSIFWRF